MPLSKNKTIASSKSNGYFEQIENVDFLQDVLPIDNDLKDLLMDKIKTNILSILEQTFYRKGVCNPIIELQKRLFNIQALAIPEHDYRNNSPRKLQLTQILPLRGFLGEIKEYLAIVASPELFATYNHCIKKAEQSIDKADFLIAFPSFKRTKR